jgi:hypothetical protein
MDEGSQRRIGPRSTSTMDSTSYVVVEVNASGVNDQVDVDDHDGEDRSALDEDL